MSEVRMPKMGDGMEEGTILRWLKREGDTVQANEPIAEIETDKANVEMPAEESGTLTKIIVQKGQTVPVGAVIAQIGGSGAASAAGNGAVAPDRAAAGDAGSPPREAANENAAPLAGLPAPREEAARRERVKASPLARKTARELGIDLALIQGTGPGGQIRQRDVLAFHEKGGASPLVAGIVAPAQAVTSQPAPKPSAHAQQSSEVEVSRMRKTIARRTTQSVQTAPHFYVTIPVEMDRAMQLLADLSASVESGKVTVNDLIVKACAEALRRFPDVNVSYTAEDRIRRHAQVNIGIAVVSDEGLTMPVINDCASKSLREISSEARGLVGKARAGELTPQEMSGGTFSVSNLGMFGVEEFTAIINQPESAILAVGAVLPEVVVDESGAFEARKRMRITLSCDHRAVDGVLGARFLQEVKRLLESPLSLLA